MQLDKLHKELSMMADQIKGIVHAIMEGEKGINAKTGTNTLIDSNLYNDMVADVKDLELIQFLIHDYYIYVESGRKQGSFPPPHVIAEWCARKGIPNDNRTVYAICNSIYIEGIKPRPFLDEAWDVIDDYWDSWAEDIFNILTEDIEKWFNN